MSVLLSWLSGSATLSASFDAVTTETHNATANVTTHPVEQGSDVADHVYISPLTLSLEAVVTNTPLRTPTTQESGSRGEVRALDGANANTLQFDGAMHRPVDVYLDLRDAFRAKSVFTVDTAIGNYDDMVITSLSAPREVGSGLDTQSGTRVDKLTFSIEMTQIRVASSREGKVTRKPKNAPKQKKDKGSQPKKEATELESSAHAVLY